MAVMPSMPGMEMSVITTSGFDGFQQLQQLVAVARLGDHLRRLDVEAGP
jgi:hypothetical protein